MQIVAIIFSTLFGLAVGGIAILAWAIQIQIWRIDQLNARIGQLEEENKKLRFQLQIDAEIIAKKVGIVQGAQGDGDGD